MASLLERYLSGRHIEVWQDLSQLGATVRDRSHYQDAVAVGTETMKRARHNVELLITKLDNVGYRFTQEADPPERINFAIAPESDSLKAIREKYARPDFVPKTDHEKKMVAKIKSINATQNLMTKHSDLLAQIVNAVRNREKRDEVKKDRPSVTKDPSVFSPASPRDERDMDRVEKKLKGPLPISLRCWYEQVGGVNFMGYHETLNPKEGSESPDPLVVDPFMDAIHAWFGEDLEFEESEIELPLAPDDISKAFQSGGDPYAIKLPDSCADGLFLNEPHNTTFVNYLRFVFQWGGFPGWERASRRPDKELNFLREGLLPL